MFDRRIGGKGLSLLVAAGFLAGGCQSRLATEEAHEAFRKAGPVEMKVDESRITRAKKPQGAYRVGPGDVLRIYMPRVLGTVQDKLVLGEENASYHQTRVDSKGRITVPLLGRVKVEDLTLQGIGEKLVNGYHPELMQEPPSVVARVDEFYTQPVTVIGAVEEPGTYDLRRREMSLTTLLSKAEGIRDEGASAIRIRRENGEARTEPILLPVEGLDVEFRDVALKAGDVVEVKRLDRQSIAVVGLVKKPTTIEYEDPTDEFTLMQALALAGGLNEVAGPEHATVYRQNREGEVVGAKFDVKGSGSVPKGADVKLKPGDIVAVEPTAVTSFRVILTKVLRIGIDLEDSFRD